MQLDNAPIFLQLQVEEALLRIDTRNWCIINKGTPPAIVMGISGNTKELINADAFLKNPVPVIRRFSGGGTVVVDEKTLFVTWIANVDDTQIPCCPKGILEWTADFYKPVFDDIDFRLMENDYAIGNKKCGGNAQYLCKGRWLHHTSFLWDYTNENMNLLKIPQKMPAYRQHRPHDDFLCRLKDHYPACSELLKRLIFQVQQLLKPTPAKLEDITPLLEHPHRRSTHYVQKHPQENYDERNSI